MSWICNGVEFKEGDRVRVVSQEVDDAEDGMGTGCQWENAWIHDDLSGDKGMDAYLGLEFTIEEITVHGATFESTSISYGFPLTALEKVG